MAVAVAFDPPDRSRADRIRDEVVQEVIARRAQIEAGGLSSVTIIVTLDRRGLPRRVSWRTEGVRECREVEGDDG